MVEDLFMMIMIVATMMSKKVMTVMMNDFCKVINCFYVSINSTQSAFTCSNLTTKTPEQYVKSVKC